MRSVELIPRLSPEGTGPAYFGNRAIPAANAVDGADLPTRAAFRDDHVAVYLALDEARRLQVTMFRSRGEARVGGADNSVGFPALGVDPALPTSGTSRSGYRSVIQPRPPLQNYQMWLDDAPRAGTLIDARM